MISSLNTRLQERVNSAPKMRVMTFVASMAMVLLASCKDAHAYSPSVTRRGWISKAINGVVATPALANALEQRNEMLCGTGFFTNIAQYKCTDIGDISGDGKAKDLSKEEESSVDSLMGKLGLDEGASFVTEKSNDGNAKVSTTAQES